MRSWFLIDDATDGLNTRTDDRDSLRARLDAEDRADHLAGVAPLHDAEVDREHERLVGA